MATVQELKDTLETEQARAIELADQSLSAIGQLTTLSTWTLGVLGFIIGILAIFGYGLIASGARRSSEKVAKDYLDTYIKSQDFLDSMSESIRKEVAERMKDKMIMANLSIEPENDGKSDPIPPKDSEK